MKRTKKGILIVGILALAAGLVVVLSQKGKEDGTDAYDFWKETYEAVARKTKGASRYEETPWKVGAQDRKQAVEADYPDFFIGYMEDENGRQTETTLSMQHDGSSQEKKIELIYEVKEFAEENLKAEKEFKIESSDYLAKQFDTSYSVYEYLNGVFDRSETQEGYLHFNGNDVDYIELPLMKEAMEHFDKLTGKIEEEFGVAYDQTNFIDLPALCEGIAFSEEIPEEIQTLDYFSDVHYNARGYGIVTFLKVEDDFQTATYGTYDVTRQGYGFNYTMNLIPRAMENGFDLDTVSDIEKEMVYFDGDTAYIYPADWKDEEILADVRAGAENAVSVLSTQNKNYEDYETMVNG